MGGILLNAPMPIADAIARPKRREYGQGSDPQEGRITQAWMDFMTSLNLAVQSAPARVASVALVDQSASIGATDITDGSLSAGVYRFSYYAQIVQAASISSSLTVTLDWQTGGVAQAFSKGAMTGNTTATNQSDSILIRIDTASPVRYSTTYASAGGTPMKYAVNFTLEEVEA